MPPKGTFAHTRRQMRWTMVRVSRRLAREAACFLSLGPKGLRSAKEWKQFAQMRRPGPQTFRLRAQYYALQKRCEERSVAYPPPEDLEDSDSNSSSYSHSDSDDIKEDYGGGRNEFSSYD